MTSERETSTYPLGPALDLMRKISALNHALERLSSHMDRTFGVTAQQRLVLRCVGTYPGITAGRLATVLHLDPGTISASLRRLVERRLVVRRHDSGDRRRVVLGLTAKGRELDRPTVGTVEHAIQELLAETSSADIATTATTLVKLSGLLERATGDPRSPADRAPVRPAKGPRVDRTRM